MDTHPDAARAQIELLRRASVTARAERALALSQWTIELSRRAIRRAMGDASAREASLRFVELHYGKDLAARVRHRLEHEP